MTVIRLWILQLEITFIFMRYFMVILNYDIKYLLFCKEKGSVYLKDINYMEVQATSC